MVSMYIHVCMYAICLWNPSHFDAVRLLFESADAARVISETLCILPASNISETCADSLFSGGPPGLPVIPVLSGRLLRGSFPLTDDARATAARNSSVHRVNIHVRWTRENWETPVGRWKIFFAFNCRCAMKHLKSISARVNWYLAIFNWLCRFRDDVERDMRTGCFRNGDAHVI